MDCLRAERISSSSSASTSAARPGSCTQRAYQPQRNSRERHYSGVCVVAAVVTEARPQTKTPQAAVLQSFGGFDHLNQQIREGHHEAHLVDKQATKVDPDQPTLASTLPLFNCATVAEACVVGCGPAGLALAAELALKRIKVVLVGHDRPFVNNYGVWTDEFRELGLEHTLEGSWQDALCYFGDGPEVRIQRSYSRVCRRKLRQHLLDKCAAAGVQFQPGEVHDISCQPQADMSTLTLDNNTQLRARHAPRQMPRIAAILRAHKLSWWTSYAPPLCHSIRPDVIASEVLHSWSQQAADRRHQIAFGCMHDIVVHVISCLRCCTSSVVLRLAFLYGATALLHARLITLAAGQAAGKFLQYEKGAPTVGVQTAYGIEAEVEGYEGAYDPNSMLFMDFRRHHTGIWSDAGLRTEPGEHPAGGEGLWGTTQEVPSFLYAMRLPNGSVFLEETCLVAKPALPFATLKRRLHRRLNAMGITVKKVHDEEWSYIPVGGPLPNVHQGVTAFGAAANLVHPATGYSIVRSLREAPALADSIAQVLQTPAMSADMTAHAVWDALWPREKRRQAAFHVFGMELLARLDLSATNDFFATFFRLPDSFWRGFLASQLSSSKLVVFALLTFVLAPTKIRWHLVHHFLSHPAGIYMLRTYAGVPDPAFNQSSESKQSALASPAP